MVSGFVGKGSEYNANLATQAKIAAAGRAAQFTEADIMSKIGERDIKTSRIPWKLPRKKIF